LTKDIIYDNLLNSVRYVNYVKYGGGIMTIEERREREKEEMRELILSAADEIVASEGFDKLSVRKIANKIEDSASIIYHYFTDKDEILHNLMQRGYKKMEYIRTILLLRID
jgi:AcrR family transcriptional regulator